MNKWIIAELTVGNQTGHTLINVYDVFLNFYICFHLYLFLYFCLYINEVAGPNLSLMYDWLQEGDPLTVFKVVGQTPQQLCQQPPPRLQDERHNQRDMTRFSQNLSHSVQ